MTKEQKLDMFSMHLDGLSYREIGNKYGISGQAVYKMIHPKERDIKNRTAKWVYPNVATWAEGQKMTANKIAKAIGVYPATVLSLLKGSTGTSQRVISKMLDLTGMTYEEFFYQPKQ